MRVRLVVRFWVCGGCARVMGYGIFWSMDDDEIDAALFAEWLEFMSVVSGELRELKEWQPTMVAESDIRDGESAVLAAERILRG